MEKARKRTKPSANLNGHQSYGQYKELPSLAMSLVLPYSYHKSQSQPLFLLSKDWLFILSQTIFNTTYFNNSQLYSQKFVGHGYLIDQASHGFDLPLILFN